MAVRSDIYKELNSLTIIVRTRRFCSAKTVIFIDHKDYIERPLCNIWAVNGGDSDNPINFYDTLDAVYKAIIARVKTTEATHMQPTPRLNVAAFPPN